jgi:hypothetical protein
MLAFKQALVVLLTNVGDAHKMIATFVSCIRDTKPKTQDLNYLQEIVFELEQALQDAKSIRDSIEEQIEANKA